MQQGYAGGFADNFTGNNVIFYSACGANENAPRANNTPYLENELWNNVPYHHGEYNFHTYSPMAGLSPGDDDEYIGVAYASADANSVKTFEFRQKNSGPSSKARLNKLKYHI